MTTTQQTGPGLSSPAGFGDDDAVPGIDLTALTLYLDGQLEGGVRGTLTASLISGGRSNPTYEIADSRRTWILRRPPLGRVLPSAHNMEREYRVIHALSGTVVPVPKPVLMCSSTNVLGAPFYLMEKIDGQTIRTPEDAAELPVEDRGRLGMAMADTLAALHKVDPAAVGLSDFGRPEGYLDRQLDRWEAQWRASRTKDRPEVDLLLDILRRTVPTTLFSGIVHGDFKIDNVMVANDDGGSVIAVLDWEMATLGDTLADVGILLSFWDEPGRPHNPVTGGLTAVAGFPSRAEVLERYSKQRGIELPETDWYVVFADMKIAVILEGIHARYLGGQTVGAGFEDIEEMVGPLLKRALDLAESAL
jgi:aminoglycoside phosphotransferase (APT) family kinase protein